VTEKRQCPKCRAELSPGAAQGLCPKCLLDAGLESQAASASGEAATGPFVTPSQAAAATIPKPERFAAPGLETLAGQFPQLDSFEHLGRGGMGVVYKARQRNLNRPVAVKILPPSSGDDPAFAERFTREAQALARLNHPNIVQVHDFGRTEDHFYFIMEYVDGVNLRALIRDGKLKPEEALKIVPQICEALQFAHDEGIVHRDIKPENILIDKKGRVKIADFGLAKLLGLAADDLSLTGTGQLMGTLGYMAPEQLQQAHAVDHRADIYSLGVVFYEMLTGQLPIGRFEPPSKKVQVDVRLDDVVLRSLASEPDRRYQHVSEVKTDVEQIASDGRSAQAAALRPQTGAARWRIPQWSEISKEANTRFAIGVSIATILILAASFTSWGQFRGKAELELPFVGGNPLQGLEFTFTMNGWNGSLSFGNLKVPNWLVPLEAVTLAGLFWLKALSIWKTPTSLPVVLVAASLLQLGNWFVLLMRSEHASVDFGLVVTALGFVSMLGILFRQFLHQRSTKVPSKSLQQEGRS
jgi:serine/threonine protein kinase